ncbi:MAG: translocation/assembly module TamB domain-containing protein, partial [Flavobacteriaceae bacterium]
TNVVIQLSDELENPTIGFDIEFPGTNSIVKSELEYRLQDPTIEEKNAIFLLAQGTFVNAQTGISSQAITGEILQTAVGGLNQMLGGDNDKFNLGLNYEKAAYDPDNVLETDDRIGVTLSTKINDRLLFNGKVGVPVGGNESYVAGDFELQWLLNEEGSLSAKFFNRESEIQELSTDRQGYTQGMGISYEVDFNSFGELFRRLLTSRSKQAEPPVVKREVSQPDGQSGDPRSISFTHKDSLIQFQPKEKK